MKTPAKKPKRRGRDKSIIVCRLCGKPFKAISWSHLLYKHGEDSADAVALYKRRFGIKYVSTDAVRRGRRRKYLAYLERTGRRWTRARIVKEIRLRIRRGMSLNYTAVLKDDPHLYTAGRLRLHGWDRALRAAGVDPESVRKMKTWSAEKVIEAIRERRRRGKPLNYAAVREDDPRLCSAAKKRFQNWDNALRSAGMNPDNCRKNRRWTRKLIIDSIRLRRRRDQPLNAKGVRISDSPLLSSACSIFKNWDNALRAAGFDPDTIRMTQIWTPQKVIDAIRERHRRGAPLNHNDVPASLTFAAYTRFHRWSNALRAAGIDPKSVRKPTKWNANKVVESIRERRRLGKGLNSNAVMKDDRFLVTAAQRYFQGWDRALRSAGLNPADIRKTQTWTRKTIVAAIRNRRRQGMPLNAGSVHDSCAKLILAASIAYGTWDNALRAAGFDPDTIRMTQIWTPQKVIDAIRDLRRRGKPMNAAFVQHTCSKLDGAARKVYGNWDNALRAAGVDPESVRKLKTWSAKKVIEAIRERRDRGLALYPKALRKDDRPLNSAVTRYFRNWGKAFRAAGIDPKSVPRYKERAVKGRSATRP